jgi:hypothetical protein
MKRTRVHSELRRSLHKYRTVKESDSTRLYHDSHRARIPVSGVDSSSTLKPGEFKWL